MERYDIAVIGLGPAGSAFCMSVDTSKYRVIALDKKDTGFSKPCGGLLAPDAQKALARLGKVLPKQVLVDPQVFSVRTIDFDSSLQREYQRFYLNMDRDKFDRWMIDQIPDGVQKIRDANVFLIEKKQNEYHVSFHTHSGDKKIVAKMLVGADGADSKVLRFLRPKYKPRSYMAIQQWYADDNPRPEYTCIFDSRVTDSYSWTLSKDGSFIFGGAYPIDQPRRRFDAQKQKLKQIGFVFGTPLKTEACLVRIAKTPRDFYLGTDTVFLVGEAAGLVSPSSLEGMSSAVISGCNLARVINSNSNNIHRRYQRASRSLIAKLSAKLLKCPVLYTPFLRKLVMKSGITAIK